MLELIDKLSRIAAMAPDSPIGISVKLLVEDLVKHEQRRQGQRKRTLKWRAKTSPERHRDITVTPSPSHHPNVTVTLQEQRLYKEVSKKEESKNSNRRVSGKRSQIPPDLECSDRNRQDAIKAGMAPELIASEWISFRDHHRHKGTLGIDWDAGWRRWCSNHVKWKQPERNQDGRQGNVIRAAADLVDLARRFEETPEDIALRVRENQTNVWLLSEGGRKRSGDIRGSS